MLSNLRSSAASSRQFLLPLHYFSSYSSKKMTGGRTPDPWRPRRRGSIYDRGSVSDGKLSMHRDGSLSTSSSVSRQNTSPELVRAHAGHTVPDRLTSDSTVTCHKDDQQRSAFDICKTEKAGVVRLQKTLLEINRAKRKELQGSNGSPQCIRLRPGMILLKNYIDHHNQVKIVNLCQRLGISPAGFYQPGYRDGGKLHLQMMCLGKNWDAESRKYEDLRPSDCAVPPKIPLEFTKLVDEALKTAQVFLRKTNGCVNGEVELPSMSPDICIVNFYNDNGRLGLHQDRDESKESIQKGLPVVSFSIGDSAEFLYGEERDSAANVVLESGDVLIFGGESRLIFHGVSSIKPNTAPKSLIEETKLKPGRLNLTFRQY